MNETIATILSRRSVRSYQAQQIGEEELNLILTAATYAPSGLNKQLWHFTAIQNKAYIDTISNGAKAEMRKLDAPMFQERANNPEYHLFFQAPTVIVVSSDGTPRSATDCALATENMVLAAQSLGIGSCIIGSGNLFFDTAEGREFCTKLATPEGFSPLLSVALGYSSTEPLTAPERRSDVITIIR